MKEELGYKVIKQMTNKDKKECMKNDMNYKNELYGIELESIDPSDIVYEIRHDVRGTNINIRL